MKNLITIVSLTITSLICYGQSDTEKSVYSIKKDAPVIYEDKSALKMDATEMQSRTSVSANKNMVVTPYVNANPSDADSTAIKQKMVMPVTNKKEIEVPRE